MQMPLPTPEELWMPSALFRETAAHVTLNGASFRAPKRRRRPAQRVDGGWIPDDQGDACATAALPLINSVRGT